MNHKLLAILLGLLLILPGVLAVEFDDDISPEDQETFDQILSPVMKIYNFIKYAATVLAVVFLVFAGISFILSGGDTAKRESAKSMATYIVIGLIIIWVAPLIVQYLVELTHNEIEMLLLVLDMIETMPGGLTPTEQGIRRKIDHARSLPSLKTQ